MSQSDSAGIPWAGRTLRPHPFQGDTGRAPDDLAAALARVAAAPLDADAHVAVVAALAGARLFSPIVASLGEAAEPHEHGGHGGDKSADMAMVTLRAADGRAVVPGFSDIPTLTSWRPGARPVPVSAERLALAAVEAEAPLVVLDPGGAGEFLLRRPALWAFAQGQPWRPSWADPRVADEVAAAVARLLPGVALGISPGHPQVHRAGPELRLGLGLTADETARVSGPLHAEIGRSELLLGAIDSLALSPLAPRP